MKVVSIIALDLAENVCRAHGAAADGAVVFRRELSRAQVMRFFSRQQPCTVGKKLLTPAHRRAAVKRSMEENRFTERRARIFNPQVELSQAIPGDLRVSRFLNHYHIVIADP